MADGGGGRGLAPTAGRLGSGSSFAGTHGVPACAGGRDISLVPVLRPAAADASGQIVKLCGLSTGIDAQVRAEEALRASERRSQAVLAGEKRLLEMVAGGRPMREILTSLCRLVESIASGCSCSVVLLDPNGTELQEAIAPSVLASMGSSWGWPWAPPT